MPQRDRIVTIERPIATRDGFGSEIVKWFPVAELWAAYRPIRASEQFRRGSNRTQAIRVVDFTIAHRPDITETMRVVYDGLVYGIIGISSASRSELILP